MRRLPQLHGVSGGLPPVLALRGDIGDSQSGLDCAGENRMEVKFAVPRLALPARMVVSAGFAAGGLALQVLIPGGFGFVIGVLLMVPGLVFMAARNFRN